MTQEQSLDLNKYDPLTGLPNRIYGAQKVVEQCASVGMANVSAIAVEICRFGQINNSVGNRSADKILTLITQRLQKLFPYALCFYRTHGDQFFLLFERSVDMEFQIERLLDFVRRPFAVSGNVVLLTVKIGVAEHSKQFESADELVHAAELALYQTKGTLDLVCYFQAGMVEKAKVKHQMANDLRVATLNNSRELLSGETCKEFVMVYHPIVSSKKRKIIGFEALIRWRHPEKGVVMPGTFIPIAEESGVIDMLGNWAINRACKDLASWRVDNQLANDMFVSINVSPVQMLQADNLVEAVKDAVTYSGIKAEQLVLEVTEPEDISVLPVTLNNIKQLGCKIAIDNFGMGYSSISRVAELPLDYIKIGRSFIQRLDSHDEQSAQSALKIATAMYELAKAFDVPMISEGIQTESQLNSVLSLGGDLTQGYYYVTPMISADVDQYITTFTG